MVHDKEDFAYFECSSALATQKPTIFNPVLVQLVVSKRGWTKFDGYLELGKVSQYAVVTMRGS